MDTNTYDKLMALRILPSAYEQWKGYRECLTEYIISNTLPKTQAMVIGAGACNDLELLPLAEHFKELVLADIDTDAVEKGLDKQSCRGLKESGRIKVIKSDIAGIPEDLYRNFCTDVERCIRRNTADHSDGSAVIDGIFEKYQKTAKQAAESNMGFSKMLVMENPDYIVCCGVHSQLYNIFPQLAELYGNYAAVDKERVYAYASGINKKLACRVNKSIISGAKKGTIFGLETGRLGMQDGIEGAYQALKDIEERIKINNWETEEVDTVWPFSIEQGKIYNMKLINICF